MDADPNLDFLSWAKISQQAIKTKSACINYLEQFLTLLKSYFNSSHKLPKPNEQYTLQFENEVIPNAISNDILINDGNDIFVTNLTTILKEINILFFEDILKFHFQHINTFLLIFKSSNKLYLHGMTPFDKGSTFSDVCTNFLRQKPFQRLLKAISNNPSFPLFYIIYSLFDDLRDFVDSVEIENIFDQTSNQFNLLLRTIKTSNLNEIKPEIISSCLKFIFNFTSKRPNYSKLWGKCADFLLFSLQNGNSEHQTKAAKSIYQMAILSDLYRTQVLDRIKSMNLVKLLMTNEYEEKLIGYFTLVISQFPTICMPSKSEILRLYDIITESENSKLKPLFLFFIKNLPTENSVDLLSTIFDTRPTTKKHIEILSLCLSELIILNFMVGNKIINHFMVLIDNDETAEVSILFFQKILPLPLPKEIISSIVDIANRKISEPTIKESSISFMKTIIIIPNPLTVKYTFSLFNSIAHAIQNHEDKAEILFDMIATALTIYHKSVLSTEQLKILLPIINKNQWWDKLSTIFVKRTSLFFTSNGLIEFENEINKLDFERASTQFTLFMITFISYLCVYKKIYNLSNGNYISVQNIPDLHYIIRIVLKTPDHQSFVYVMNYYIFIWNHLEKVTSREATLHFLKCFKPYIEKDIPDEVKNRIFILMSRLIDVLEKSISVEDFGVKRHKQSNISEVNITVSIENHKTFSFLVKENQTLENILKKTAFLLGLSYGSIKFKDICDPYISIKQTNLRKFNFEIINEKKVENRLSDFPTQIFVENKIDEILLSYLEHENSIDAWNLLVQLPTNKSLMKKLSNPNEIHKKFVTSDFVSKLYFRYEIETLLEVIKNNSNSNSSSFENYGTFILNELIKGRIEGEEITPSLEIIYLSDPDLNDTEIKDTLIFLLSKGENGFTPLFEKLAQKYPNQICNFFMVQKSIDVEFIYSAPVEYTSIICSLGESYDREIVFQYLIELVPNLYKFKNSIEPVLLLYDKIISTQEEALLLIEKNSSIIQKLKQNQFPGLCNSLLKILNRFPGIEDDISRLIPYIINQLYGTDDLNSILNFLIKFKKQSTSEISKILNTHSDFFNYSAIENKRCYFTALKNDVNKDMSFFTSLIQQLFFNQFFRNSIISEKVEIEWYSIFRKLFCILQFSILPFYPISDLFSSMQLGNMSNPSRLYDFIMSHLPQHFTSPFTGTLLDLQQDLTSQVITSEQAKFLKLELDAIERYSVTDCLEHFFREEKVAFKQAVHHFTIGEFPNVLVLLLKIFVYDHFEDLLSKIGTTITVCDTLQLSIKSNVTNSPVYNLRGVIYHKGRIYGGRYVSQIFHQSKSYLFDNDTVQEFERTEDMSPYLIFYVRQGADEDEVMKSIEKVPDDMEEFIKRTNENYQRNQVLFSDDFRMFVLNFDDALLITKYLINVFCHSKFNPNLVTEFLNKDLTNVTNALRFYQNNISIINELKNSQMKKMILYLAEVLIEKATPTENGINSIIDFFSECIEKVDPNSLSELMIYYLTQIDSNGKSEITENWGDRIADIIINGQPKYWLLFPILSALKYSDYQIFFNDNNCSSMIFSDHNSLNSLLNYLKSIEINSIDIIELTPSEFVSNLIISALITDFTEILSELLKSRSVEKKSLLQTFVNGLDNKIEGLRDSIISHFPFFLDFLPNSEGKFAEAVIYCLFPDLTNPIDRDRKRMRYNDFTSVYQKDDNSLEEDDGDDTNNVEEEEEEWEEEEVKEINSESAKIDKVEKDVDKDLLNQLFQLTVKFILNLNDDQPLFYTLRVIEWMAYVGDFINEDLINACLRIMQKKIENKRTVKSKEICLILKIMKNCSSKFFSKHFSDIMRFTLPTSHPSIFSHFFYTTSDFLKDDSNISVVQILTKSSQFFDSLRHFLKKSKINDLDLFIENTQKIKNLSLAGIMSNGLLRRLTIQKVICYQTSAQEIDKKMANHLIRFFFKKCTSFKEKYIPLFGWFSDSIARIMKLELSRSSLYLKNMTSFFSLFEKDKSKLFRKELRKNIIIMSQSDKSVCTKFVELIINCQKKKKSKQLQIDLFSTFFYICEDPKLINHNLEMLANFIDNCKQKEVLDVLGSINSMLSKRTKKLNQNNGYDDKDHFADGIEIESISEVLIILYDYYDWMPELANCFEYILMLIPKNNVFPLIEALLNVIEEKDDDESSRNDADDMNHQNNRQPFSHKISVGVLTDVIQKGVSFVKARPEMKKEILDMFEEGGFLENWPPSLQEYRSFYFDN